MVKRQSKAVMSTLTPHQVLFVLRSVGKEWIYSDGRGRPGESFPESFLHEIETPVGALAVKLAFQSQLEYEPIPPRGKIILKTPLSVDQIRSELQMVGARLPDIYRGSPEKALEYLEVFGHLYLPFDSPETPLIKEPWLPGLQPPLLTGADIWVNPNLSTHLRDLYTDFDLFNSFGAILPEPTELNSRQEIVDWIAKYHRPAGYFWIGFGFTELRLSHQLGQRTQTYIGPNAIKSIASGGQLYFEGLPLPHVGLYQLAFLFKPEYTFQIYGIEPSDLLMNIIREVYRHLLDQIKEAEERGEQRIRFSEQLREFNSDLS